MISASSPAENLRIALTASPGAPSPPLSATPGSAPETGGASRWGCTASSSAIPACEMRVRRRSTAVTLRSGTRAPSAPRTATRSGERSAASSSASSATAASTSPPRWYGSSRSHKLVHSSGWMLCRIVSSDALSCAASEPPPAAVCRVASSAAIEYETSSA